MKTTPKQSSRKSHYFEDPTAIQKKLPQKSTPKSFNKNSWEVCRRSFENIKGLMQGYKTITTKVSDAFEVAAVKNAYDQYMNEMSEGAQSEHPKTNSEITEWIEGLSQHHEFFAKYPHTKSEIDWGTSEYASWRIEKALARLIATRPSQKTINQPRVIQSYLKIIQNSHQTTDGLVHDLIPLLRLTNPNFSRQLIKAAFKNKEKILKLNAIMTRKIQSRIFSSLSKHVAQELPMKTTISIWIEMHKIALMESQRTANDFHYSIHKERLASENHYFIKQLTQITKSNPSLFCSQFIEQEEHFEDAVKALGQSICLNCIDKYLTEEYEEYATPFFYTTHPNPQPTIKITKNPLETVFRERKSVLERQILLLESQIDTKENKVATKVL